MLFHAFVLRACILRDDLQNLIHDFPGQSVFSCHSSFFPFLLIFVQKSQHHQRDADQAHKQPCHHTVRHIGKADLMRSFCQSQTHQSFSDAVRFHNVSVHPAGPVPVISVSGRMDRSGKSASLRFHLFQHAFRQRPDHFLFQFIRAGIDNGILTAATVELCLQRCFITVIACFYHIQMIREGGVCFDKLWCCNHQLLDTVRQIDIDLLSLRDPDAAAHVFLQGQVPVQCEDRIMPCGQRNKVILHVDRRCPGQIPFPDVGIRKESDRKRIVILIDGQVVVFGQGFKPVEGAPPAVGAQNIPDAEHIVHQIRNAVVPVLVGAGLHADLIAEIRHGLLHG